MGHLPQQTKFVPIDLSNLWLAWEDGTSNYLPMPLKFKFFYNQSMYLLRFEQSIAARYAFMYPRYSKGRRFTYWQFRENVLDGFLNYVMADLDNLPLNLPALRPSLRRTKY